MGNMKLHIPLARNKAGRREKSLKTLLGQTWVCVSCRQRDLDMFEPGEEGSLTEEQRLEGTEGFPPSAGSSYS